MLMLTLDDAVDVVRDYIDPELEECLRNDLEQKCYCPSEFKDPVRTLYDCTFDIRPKEIVSHIETDHLCDWCKELSNTMIIALHQIEFGG